MDVFRTADAAAFDVLGTIAQVRRGPAHLASVRVVVRDGVERLGEFQQVIGRARHVLARNADWIFRRGDEVIVDGRTQAVEAIVGDDGLVNEAALYG
ncbi:hypothetical protein J5226_03545 [Lysobacter sp. K5869]|uniref:hypothetical protein n=1 Tax=Lysobacter sp. K5869 TaxID=2820808 RepID=UPI001C063E9C|nr:hypothetical protein [Lysobacter sp. K5869]QWP77492.1 hypothetical protein J5226_03545 [Lysobacter sp. K5869]